MKNDWSIRTNTYSRLHPNEQDKVVQIIQYPFQTGISTNARNFEVEVNRGCDNFKWTKEMLWCAGDKRISSYFAYRPIFKHVNDAKA